MGAQQDAKKVQEIARYSVDVIEKTAPQYEGVLLCEGNENSVDVRLYQAVYPNLLVIPVGGWSQVKNYHPLLKRKIGGYPVYGIIDRDSLLKNEIRRIKRSGIYCTKLPFIENIISCPEIVRILCENCHKDYANSLSLVTKKLLKVLSKKLRDALPINIALDPSEPVVAVTIRIRGAYGSTVEKTVDEANIIYAYRDKAVANEVSEVLGILGRKRYYNFFISALEDDEMREKIVKAASKYLPQIEVK